MHMFNYALLCAPPGEGGGDVYLNMAKEGLKYNKQTLHHSSEHMLRRHYAALPIAAQCKGEHETVFIII